jgi:hypothetical protein
MTIEYKAKEKAESILRQRMSSIKPTNSSPAVVMNLESEHELQKLTSLLAKMREKRNAPPIVEDITTEESLQTPQSLYRSLPSVRPASERISSNADDDFAQLQAISSSSSSQNAPAPLLNPIKLNTRLNGKHRGNWKMSKSDNFLKVCS